MCVRACVDAGFAMRSWDVLSFIAFAIVTLIVYHDRFPPPLFARVSLVNGTGRTGADTGPRLEVPTALRSSSSGLASALARHEEGHTRKQDLRVVLAVVRLPRPRLRKTTTWHPI